MATTDTESLPSIWTIILFWTGSNAVSIFSGILFGSFLNEILWTPNLPLGVGSFITNPIQRAFVIGLSIGGIKSLLEEVILKKWKIKWNGWLPANILGWAGGVTVAVGLAMFHSESGINELIGGMIIGFSQWMVLRRYLPKAYWWIIASVIGSFAILNWIPLGYTSLMMLESFIVFIIAGLFMGIMTGATLSWLIALSWLEER